MTQGSVVLIVDDQALGRQALEALLDTPEYRLALAADGPEALQKATELSPDLILLDVMMPGMDGFEVCRRLRADENLAEVPIVMVTALDDDGSRLCGIEAGADDFVIKPFNRHELRARVRTITRLNRYRRLIEERSALRKAHEDLLLAYDATIEGWVHALDLRDKETEGHSLRVTGQTVRLARAMGVADEQIVHIRRGALLHDIGKLGVPDAVLLKPGPLNNEEWTLMRMHPQYAYDMLAPILYLRPALEVPFSHHEKWDGSGYPLGLKGEEIPLSARIFAVVDVWDALNSDRIYRPRWPRERVLAHIHEQAGHHFDPEVVGCFIAMLPVAA